jgi:hypothetical protein
MKKEIADAVERVVERIKELSNSVPEDHSIVIAGIGNSVGIR